MGVAFQPFGELVAEFLKPAALLTFRVLITPAFFGDIAVTGFVFAFFDRLLVRSVAIGISLRGAGLERREWAVAAWFGPMFRANRRRVTEEIGPFNALIEVILHAPG